MGQLIKDIIAFLFHKRKMPKNGQFIIITWLHPNNAWPERNVYIGTKGVVEMSESDGFCVNSGNSIVSINKPFRYKQLNQPTKDI